jgi:hypothetical protein
MFDITKISKNVLDGQIQAQKKKGDKADKDYLKKLEDELKRRGLK